MAIIDKIKAKARADVKRIVLPEGEDEEVGLHLNKLPLQPLYIEVLDQLLPLKARQVVHERADLADHRYKSDK